MQEPQSLGGGLPVVGSRENSLDNDGRRPILAGIRQGHPKPQTANDSDLKPERNRAGVSYRGFFKNDAHEGLFCPRNAYQLCL